MHKWKTPRIQDKLSPLKIRMTLSPSDQGSLPVHISKRKKLLIKHPRYLWSKVLWSELAEPESSMLK